MGSHPAPAALGRDLEDPGILTSFSVCSQRPTPVGFALISEPPQNQSLNLQTQIPIHVELVKLTDQSRLFGVPVALGHGSTSRSTSMPGHWAGMAAITGAE